MPEISAVIPTRNRARIVCRAVESVLSQTFQDLEVIVVIDGPDPATVALLQTITDPRIRILQLEESIGASEARNRGVQSARGRWIGLLDDDDEWLPTKIEKQLAAALDEPAPCPFVVCSFMLKTSTKASVAPRRLPRPREPISEYLFGAPRNGFQTSGFFFPRELMLRHPWRKMVGLQDIDWFLRVVAAPGVKLVILSEPLCIYWTESENTITSKLGWRSCLEWGRRNRHLMTGRAYSSFIAKVCVHRAVAQNAGPRALFLLLKEFSFEGSPHSSSLLMFIAYCALPYRTRRLLADSLASFKRRLSLAPAGLSSRVAERRPS